jgi:DNA-binding MarR family transcriptional regulator
MKEPQRGRSPWTGEALHRAFGAAPEEYVFYLLLQANRRRDTALAAALEEIGLTAPKWHAGAVIRRLRRCNMTELSQLSAVDRTTLTRTINLMVEEGLVVRESFPLDRRQVLLTLSERGVQLIDQARIISRTLNQRFLQGVTNDHVSGGMRMLQQIVDNMIADDAVAYGVLTYQPTASHIPG